MHFVKVAHLAKSVIAFEYELSKKVKRVVWYHLG